MGRNVKATTISIPRNMLPGIKDRMRERGFKSCSKYFVLCAQRDLDRRGDFRLKLGNEHQKLPGRNTVITSISIPKEMLPEVEKRMSEIGFESRSDYFVQCVRNDIIERG